MSDIDVKMLFLSLNGESIGVVRLISSGFIQINFCFSQVGVNLSLRRFLENFEGYNEESFQNFLFGLEESGLPDFSEKDEITFDLFNSLYLSNPFDIIEEKLNSGVDLNSQYEYFTSQKLSSFSLPSKQMGELANKFKTPVELSAHVYYPEPRRLEILYSKEQLSGLAKVAKLKGIKKRINRCALPDYTLEPVEVLEGQAADVFAFFNFVVCVYG